MKLVVKSVTTDDQAGNQCTQALDLTAVCAERFRTLIPEVMALTKAVNEGSCTFDRQPESRQILDLTDQCDVMIAKVSVSVGLA